MTLRSQSPPSTKGGNDKIISHSKLKICLGITPFSYRTSSKSAIMLYPPNNLCSSLRTSWGTKHIQNQSNFLTRSQKLEFAPTTAINRNCGLSLVGLTGAVPSGRVSSRGCRAPPQGCAGILQPHQRCQGFYVSFISPQIPGHLSAREPGLCDAPAHTEGTSTNVFGFSHLYKAGNDSKLLEKVTFIAVIKVFSVKATVSSPEAHLC